MQLIGIVGAAGSGRRTVAEYLAAQHNYYHYTIDRPMKRALCESFFLQPFHFQDDACRERVIPWIGKSPAQLLRLMRMGFGSMVAEDIWLRIAQRMYEHISREGRYAGVVISDVDTASEAGWVRENRGTIWHAERPGFEQASECRISFRVGDVVIWNDATIEDLYNRISGLLLSEAA